MPEPQRRRSDFVFMKHKLLRDRMFKPIARPKTRLVFLKHKVSSVGAL